MKEKRKIEENHLALQPSLLLNNTYFCYYGECPTNNDNKKKTLFYSIRKNKNTKKSLHRQVIECRKESIH